MAESKSSFLTASRSRVWSSLRPMDVSKLLSVLQRDDDDGDGLLGVLHVRESGVLEVVKVFEAGSHANALILVAIVVMATMYVHALKALL